MKAKVAVWIENESGLQGASEHRTEMESEKMQKLERNPPSSILMLLCTLSSLIL